MPNQLDGNGLKVASLTEIVSGITAALQAIFGTDINVNPNTPDGQLINIFAQSVVDQLETLLDVYNIFFVDSAYGVALDQLVALNGIARKQGSYTQVYVQVTTSQALTLPGQDTAAPFTVADDSGTQYQLVHSYAFGAAGTVTLLFEAVLLGQIQVTANTISTIITTTLGVTGVNNPAFTVTATGNTSIGFPQITAIPSTAGMTPGMAVTCPNFAVGTTVLSVDSATQITASQNSSASTSGAALTVAPVATLVGNPEETDVQLKVRRAQSFYLATVGPSDAIRAALLAIADISDAYVAENDTAGVVSGIAANGVWIIVNGGTAAEIAQAIYATKPPGCAMTGAVTQNVTRPQGNTFTAKWDAAVAQPLYIRATLNPRLAGLIFDLTADTAALAAALIYKLGQSPCIGDVILAMATIEPNAVLSTVNVSLDGSTWIDIVTPSSLKNYFTVAIANITLTEA